MPWFAHIAVKGLRRSMGDACVAHTEFLFPGAKLTILDQNQPKVHCSPRRKDGIGHSRRALPQHRFSRLLTDEIRKSD